MATIPPCESLKVEFKSVPAGGLSDAKVLDAVVGMCNAKGGDVYLGIEDSGTISGIRDPRSKWCDANQIMALVAEQTRPSVMVRAEILTTPGGCSVAVIHVPRASSLTAEVGGRVLQRRIKKDGTPENVPVYPYEFPSRFAQLRLLDLSAGTVPGSTLEDLSPVERERLRTFIRMYHGEVPLLRLSDEELDQALGFTTSGLNDEPEPTLCGLLMIGDPQRLKKRVPSAGVTFQHLDGTRVLVNDDIDLPVIAAFEQLLTRFRACNPEREKLVDLVRLSIPDFSEEAFREGLVNAFCHRDYAVPGRIRVTMTEAQMDISSPGGFINDITPENVLTAEPRGRNPLLSDAMKRIGLAEKTGRGVDMIFESTLRFGRPCPSYSASTPSHVVLTIPRYGEDFDFLRLINAFEAKSRRTLSVLPMLILSALHNEGGRLNLDELLELLPSSFDRGFVRSVAGELVQDKVLRQTGGKRLPVYELDLARALLQAAPEKTPNAPVDTPLSAREKRTLNFLEEKSSATRADIARLLDVEPQTAYRVLSLLTQKGLILAQGTTRNRVYRLKEP